jgi:hypothetical protein
MHCLKLPSDHAPQSGDTSTPTTQGNLNKGGEPAIGCCPKGTLLLGRLSTQQETILKPTRPSCKFSIFDQIACLICTARHWTRQRFANDLRSTHLSHEKRTSCRLLV